MNILERNINEITTLVVDLDLHCSHWGLNPHVTALQRELWPGSALPHTALGTDDPSCLRLLQGDGHDGDPVGSCEEARATRFFSLADHLFPPERDLVRFGIFCHLGFFRTLHLVVKNQWEEFVLDEKGRTVESHADYVECLTKFEESALARLLDRFRMGLAERACAERLHRLFEEHGRMASKLGYDGQRFSALMDQMILSRVHYCGAGSPELESFEARQEQEIALLREVGRKEEYEFWLKKSCWLAIQTELEDKLLLREDVRLKNFNITTEWMALFGTTYIELLEAQMLCHQLETRTAIKKADPSLSDEEIDKRVKESFEAELASIEKLKGDALQAASFGLHGSEGEFLSDEQLDSYREEAKKIIREIWRLTHPDTLNRAFTERQRERLREYLEQVVRIRRSEVQLDVRAIPVLKDILVKVKELYDVMGVDLEPKSVIRGDTLAEQTAWLETEIQKIESQIQELMAEIQAMSLDPDIREKMASMDGEETRRATMLGLERLKKKFEEQVVVLQAECQRLMGEGRGEGRAPVGAR